MTRPLVETLTKPVELPDNEAKLVDPRNDAAYSHLAAEGTLFSSPPWIRAVCKAYDFEPQANLIADRDGAPIAALPFVEIADLRGPRAVAFPFSDFCPPPGADGGNWPMLLQPMLGADRPAVLRLFSDRSQPCSTLFQQTGNALWHATDVTASEEERWARLSGSARRNIRKAIASGVSVERRADREAIECFHAMHRHVRRHKYKMMAQAPSFFSAIADEFLEDGKLTVLLASHEGQAIAGIFLLEWQDTLYYKFNASVSLAVRPNDLLAWEGIKFAHEKGLTWFDFGLSDTEQEGLVRYKRKFATVEKEIVTLRHEPEGYQPVVPSQSARSLGALTTLLADDRVPDDIIDAASELLYRNFA